MNPLLFQILDILRQHRGRDAIISSSEIARRLRLPPSAARTIRRLLSEAEDDGTLEDLEMPVIGIGGLGYFLADHHEDFLLRDNLLSALAFRARTKLASWRRLAAAQGFTLHKKTP